MAIDKDDKELFSSVKELADMIKDYLPEIEKPESEGLSVGQQYVYDLDDEIYVAGTVMFNDGITAIMKVTDRYAEAVFTTLHYEEVKSYFPSFEDIEATKKSEYVCIDIETEDSIFWRDPDDFKLQIEPSKFKMEYCRKELLYELKKREEEEKQKLKDVKGEIINIQLPASAIDEMFNECGLGLSDDNTVLERSLNRSTYWLSNRSCAIISAWRGEYNRTENDRRDKELQQSLRSLGYGVIRMKGCYAEVGRAVEKENSYLVFDPNDTQDFKGNIYEHSERYNQDCFLYKPVNEDNAYLIGTNDDFGKGKMENIGILRINSDTAENYSEVGSGRISFEKG